jgi:hypothetical protein
MRPAIRNGLASHIRREKQTLQKMDHRKIKGLVILLKFYANLKDHWEGFGLANPRAFLFHKVIHQPSGYPKSRMQHQLLDDSLKK